MVRIIATIMPYKPIASPNINISTIPTNTASCSAFDFTPEYPTMPIAMPADRELTPHMSPAARCLNESHQ